MKILYTCQMTQLDLVQPIATFQKLLLRSKLSDLLESDLSFIGENSIYSLHGIHAFPAKYPPQLPALFIKHLTQEGDTILDPMAGSGTTLLEAAHLKRHFIGYDIDPLSVLICKTKTTYLDPLKISEIVNEILIASENDTQQNIEELHSYFHSRFNQETRQFIEYWFSYETIIDLTSLIRNIENIDDEKYKNFFLTVFSSIIITKSGGVSLALDLAHTRPHRSFEKKPQKVLFEYQKKVQKIISQISSIANISSGEVSYGDAKKLQLPDNSIDLVVTSPPYANNAIDYIRASKFSLVWLGIPLDKLSKTRATYIGNGKSKEVDTLTHLPPHTQSILAKLQKKDEKKFNEVELYFYDMQQCIKEISRVLKPGRPAIIVVATSLIRDIDVETHHCLAEIGSNEGLELIGMGSRSIDRNKRMLPTSKNGSTSVIEQRMHKEFVLGFVKTEKL